MALFPQNDLKISSQIKNLTSSDLLHVQRNFKLAQSFSMHSCISLCSYNNESHHDATLVNYIFQPSLLHHAVHGFEMRSNRLSREYLPSAYKQETQSNAECCFSKSTCHNCLRNLTNI